MFRVQPAFGWQPSDIEINLTNPLRLRILFRTGILNILQKSKKRFLWVNYSTTTAELSKANDQIQTHFKALFRHELVSLIFV